MSYNILGINPFHNGSACVLSDGEIVYFLEEERLSRKKYEDFPLLTILDILNKYKINEIALAGITPHTKLTTPFTQEDIYKTIVRKLNNPNIKITDYSSYHHLTHSSHAFFNSGFNKAIALVIDSSGSITYINSGNSAKIEQDSIFKFSKYSNPTLITSSSSSLPIPPKCGLGIGESYSFISKVLGFKTNEEGKTMGLSSYGGPNIKIPLLFKGNKTDPNYIQYTDLNAPYGTIYNLPLPSQKCLFR
jgi:carbamoyltransferase